MFIHKHWLVITALVALVFSLGLAMGYWLTTGQNETLKQTPPLAKEVLTGKIVSLDKGSLVLATKYFDSLTRQIFEGEVTLNINEQTAVIKRSPTDSKEETEIENKIEEIKKSIGNETISAAEKLAGQKKILEFKKELSRLRNAAADKLSDELSALPNDEANQTRRAELENEINDIRNGFSQTAAAISDLAAGQNVTIKQTDGLILTIKINELEQP